MPRQHHTELFLVHHERDEVKPAAGCMTHFVLKMIVRKKTHCLTPEASNAKNSIVQSIFCYIMKELMDTEVKLAADYVLQH